MFACFHGYVNQKKSLNLLIEPEFQTKFHSNLHSSRNERHWHKSHSPHFDWDLSIGNSSMVMSLVFLVDKFTIFSWIWRISFTCYKGITIVDIFSPCECSLQLLYIRRRQKEVCRTYLHDFSKQESPELSNYKPQYDCNSGLNIYIFKEKVCYLEARILRFFFCLLCPRNI